MGEAIIKRVNHQDQAKSISIKRSTCVCERNDPNQEINVDVWLCERDP